MSLAVLCSNPQPFSSYIRDAGEQFVKLLSWNTVHAIALTKSSKSGIEFCVKYPSPRLTYTALFQKASQDVATKGKGLHEEFGVSRQSEAEISLDQFLVGVKRKCHDRIAFIPQFVGQPFVLLFRWHTLVKEQYLDPVGIGGCGIGLGGLGQRIAREQQFASGGKVEGISPLKLACNSIISSDALENGDVTQGTASDLSSHIQFLPG